LENCFCHKPVWLRLVRVGLWEVATGKALGHFAGHSGRVASVAFSPDGKYIVSGGWDNTAKLWNAVPDEKKPGAEIRTFRGHSDRILSAKISPDGKYLITGSADATTKIWDIASGKELATLISIGATDWAVITPSGFFDASEGAKQALHFVKGTEVFELDQFFEDFYRPDLLAQVISSGAVEMPKLNVAEKISASPPPSVEIISPKPGESYSQQEIAIKVAVTDAGGGIDEVKLLHNGKRVADDERGVKPVAKINENAVIHTFTISLVDGKNLFVASAFSKGRVESRGYQLEILFQGMTMAASYIVAVGINQYKNPRLNLNYARADAEEFMALVSQKSRKLFQQVEASAFYDTAATKPNLLSALDKIARQAKPQDVFTFYYAGHGTVVENKFYFVTHENVRLEESESLRKNAIAIEELQAKFQQIKALKQLVVMDACQTGAALNLLAFRGAAEEKALAQLARSAGVHVLASAGSEQYAAEFHELGHGVFTYVLLQGLQGRADGAPPDGKVTIYELKSYLDDQVPLLAGKYKGSAQYPHTFSKGQDFPLALP